MQRTMTTTHYDSWILRVWHEPDQMIEAAVPTRIVLENARDGSRRSFDSLIKLVAFLETQAEARVAAAQLEKPG